LSASAALLRTAPGFRHGIVLPPEHVESTFADPPGIVNVGVPAATEDPWVGATGGIGWTRDAAENAGIGEALERYAAAAFPLPERRRSELPPSLRLDASEFSLFSAAQRARPDFPYRELYEGDVPYTNVFSLTDNSECWAPAALVGLGRAEGAVSTSTGLAAGASPCAALLRATEELVERDALAITWLHGLAGRRVDLPPELARRVDDLMGEAIAIDATPAYSPHPVALVAGTLPIRGAPRFALGAACRGTWRHAVEKAFLEFVQGISFAGFVTERGLARELRSPADVKTFDDHAVYYTLHPEDWARVPLLAGPRVLRAAETEASEPPPSAALARLAARLAEEGVRVFYRELTTADLVAVGVSAVRALSPDLAPLACDEEWPFLGGTVPDVQRRYPWAAGTGQSFPNPLPHPLG
jgi:ribosomal protein S12 methylthiotransferase accessory factor